MLAILLSLFQAQSVSAAKFCSNPTQFCIVSSSVNGNTCFTVHSAASGWSSFGVGTTGMSGSDMYIGWKNSSGSGAVFNFKGVGHDVSIAPSQANVIPSSLLDPQPSWSKLSYSFCRSSKATPAISASTSYIYATSNSPPTGGNLNTATGVDVPMHDEGTYGATSVNFLSTSNALQSGTISNGAILQVSATFTWKMVCEIHGAFMWVAWTLCPMIGIWVARYGKDILGHNWYRIHMGLMGGVTFLFSIAGFVMIVLYRTPQHFEGLDSMIEDVHVKAGLGIFIGVFIQVGLGYLSNHLWTPDRTFIPLVDKLHWWLGRTLTLAGIVISYLGFLIYQDRFQVLKSYYLVLCWVFVGFGALMFVYGELRIGQKHHMLHDPSDAEKKH